VDSEHRLATIKLIINGVIAVVLIVAMAWIVLSPAEDTVSKAALMVISSAVGFMFGRGAK